MKLAQYVRHRNEQSWLVPMHITTTPSSKNQKKKCLKFLTGCDSRVDVSIRLGTCLHHVRINSSRTFFRSVMMDYLYMTKSWLVRNDCAPVLLSVLASLFGDAGCFFVRSRCHVNMG
jgi:hypothetical protein